MWVVVLVRVVVVVLVQAVVGGVVVGGEDGVGGVVVCIGACVLFVMSYVADGIMVVSIILWYG